MAEGERNRGASPLRANKLRDFLGPSILLAVGCVFVALSINLRIGTLSAMGPGFLPLSFSIILCLLAVALMASTSLSSVNYLVDAAVREAPADPRAGPRGLICIIAGVACFVLVLPPFGLLPAVCASTAILSLARAGLTILTSLFLSLFVTLVVWLTFIELLGLTIVPFKWDP